MSGLLLHWPADYAVNICSMRWWKWPLSLLLKLLKVLFWRVSDGLLVCYMWWLSCIYKFVLWRNHPMREPLKCRNLKTRLCNSSERCFPLPLLRFAPCVARLCGKHWIVQQWGVTWPPGHHVQQYTTLRLHMSDSSDYRRDWRQFSQFSTCMSTSLVQ
jgi:hypothetical protein